MHGRAVLLVLALAVVLPATASAEEKLLTLYSPPIETAPYVHDTHNLALKPDGVQAPAEPGWVTGIKEQVLVDSKDPDAEPLNNAQFMIHHFVYFAPGRVDQAPGSCWANGASSAAAGRSTRTATSPRSRRRRRARGTASRTARRTAPRRRGCSRRW